VFHEIFTVSSLQIQKVVKTWSAFFTQNAKDAWKRWGSGPTGRPFETKVVNIRKQGRKRWLCG
jgi:glutaminase